MKLGRRKKIEIDRVQAEVCVNVAIELDEGMKVHRRALDELNDGGLSAATREQLLVQARQASLVCRTAFDLVDRLAELPDGMQPFGAIRSLQRVAFGMIGLAQDPPDVLAALTPEELDGAVLEEDGPEWLAWMLERAGS
jgi:hypothetical protein